MMGRGEVFCILTPFIFDYPERFSIHLMASMSLTFPRYRCVVVERLACLRITLLTISIGVPDRLAYVGACLLRSWGLSLPWRDVI